MLSRQVSYSKGAPSLRALHDALATSPAGRKYGSAIPLGSTSGSTAWALSFMSLDMREQATATQIHVCETGGERKSRIQSPFPVGTSITTSPTHGLELRQVNADGGKKLAI